MLAIRPQVIILAQDPSIVVIGCGTVGLATAVAFALSGFVVRGVDSSASRVAALNRGDNGDGESAVTNGLRQALAQGHISFESAMLPAAGRQLFVIAVPTPVEAGRPVTAIVETAFADAIAVAGPGDIVVVRSTVPVGTTRRLAARADKTDVHVVSCPDRSLSGASLSGQSSIPHVIGGTDQAATNAASELFARLGPVVAVGSAEAAEAVKLFCNVQRDTLFGLANQFAILAERLGLDFSEIRDAAAQGYKRFLPTRAGPVGGPCLPKDVHLLAGSLPNGCELTSVSLAARALNYSVVDHTAQLIAAHVTEHAYGPSPRIAVFGLAFKGGTSDERGSFGRALADKLRQEYPKADIRIADPIDPPGVLGHVASADAVVFGTDQPAYSLVSLSAIAGAMAPGGLIYDLWDLWPRCASIDLPNNIVFRVFGRSEQTPDSGE